MVARATLPPATNPILGGDLRVQARLEALLRVHIPAGFGFAATGGPVVVYVRRGRGAGLGAHARSRLGAGTLDRKPAALVLL